MSGLISKEAQEYDKVIVDNRRICTHFRDRE